MQRDVADAASEEAIGFMRPTLSNQPLKAIGLICLAVIGFSGTDTSAKYMITVGHLPAAEVVWVRFLGQFIAVVLALGLVKVPSLMASRKPGWQLVRSCLLLGATVFNFIALKTLRLDQTMTIQFMTPLTVSLLAGPLLGEWVGWRRLVAILVGFGGVLIAVRPGSGAFEFAFVWAALNMLAYAGFTLLTRHLAPYDGIPVTLFYSMFAGVALTAPAALLDWQWPSSLAVWVALTTCGVWAAVGHALFIWAFRFAPASTLAPFTYFGLVSQVAGGYFVFGQVPDAPTIAGAVVVIASGLYLLHREQFKTRERAI